jgi:two-component system response regulator NreC
VNAKLLLVDDHQILRTGLRALLINETEFSVVGEAGDVATAIALTKELKPDVVLMDVQLPDGTGIHACKQITADCPATKVLMLSGTSEPEQLAGALRAGARGYLLKDHALDELIRALHIVLSGQIYLCPEATTTLANGLTQPFSPPPPVETEKKALSSREVQVLKLIVEGKRNKEIADALKVSTKSIETYRSRLMAKLHCSGIADLVRYAIREGITKM